LEEAKLLLPHLPFFVIVPAKSVCFGTLEIMRYIYYCSLLILCFASFSTAEPYTARITADGAAVRSGPGIDFYPVLQLQTGDKVEVYYEQDGWCAIRPPIGSFSWVSAEYIDFGSGNIGTVLADGLASRIGSHDSDDCEIVQVTLKKGETVLILERREMPENSVSPVWLKIAPPSGEFRWLHKSALTSSIQQVRYDAMSDTAASEIPELPKMSESEPSQPGRSIPVPKIASAHIPSTMSSTSRTTTVDPFQRAFNELQREAYVVMTRPTDDDVFAVLIQRAEALHRIAPSDHDLEKTYHLLESLQRTRTVRRELALRRPASVGSKQSFSPLLPNVNAGVPAPQRQSIVPAYTPTAAQSVAAPLQTGVNVGGYDIVGRLGEFDPLPKGHPPYAVVDEQERIICLITPSANLDLSPHIGQFVGINGVLGIYERQGKPRARHITARNIRALR
jgi:SH3-like domain-containing protein